MRYEFGIFDYVEFMFSNTAMDTVPHFEFILKDEVDINKLYEATNKALKLHLIFATKLIYDKKYYLEDNDAPLKILNRNEAPNNFGKTTNGYLWRISYDTNTLYFDFCHGITDGRGMARFITTILEYYYDLQVTYETEPYFKGYDAIYDKNVKPLGMKKPEKGFTSKDLPHLKNGSPCKLTHMELKTKELLDVAKKTDSSPAAILLPLFSRSIYRSLPEKSKNKNVSAYFTADFRKAMNMKCGRNFIGIRYITYTKHFEDFDIETLATIYRSMMDLFLQKENIIDFCTQFKDDTKILTKIKSRNLSHLASKLAAAFEKGHTNAYLTYIGKLPFSKQLNEKIEDVKFVVYPDTGYCVMSVVDFNGTLKISLCNAYKTDAIVDNFIKVMKENSINVSCSTTTYFKQANLIF